MGWASCRSRDSPWQSLPHETLFESWVGLRWSGGGTWGKVWVEMWWAGSSNTNLFNTKVMHFSTLFKNKRSYSMTLIRFVLHTELSNFSSNRHGIGFLRYWNVNTVYRQPLHSLKRLRSVQKGTLFKTPNSENVSTPCLRLKTLKIIPCSAVHTSKSQIRKCPPTSPVSLSLQKPYIINRHLSLSLKAGTYYPIIARSV